ncbi:hypothetical protein BEI60_07960 [Eisenbergiella tayi]|nr:hypothetical protein BEI60_07960 [Eisenbergiella tayi]
MALAARYFLPCFVGRGKVPVRAHSRSDKYAAVLRLQSTQPKDRRIYTAHTGILAAPNKTGQGIPDSQGHVTGDTGAVNCNYQQVSLLRIESKYYMIFLWLS